MKTLLIICDSLEEKGGVEKIVAIQANHFIKKGFSVHILTRYKQSKISAYELDENILIDSYSWNINTKGLAKVRNFYNFINWMRGKIKQINPDAIQTHGLNVGVLSVFSATKYQRKIIACDHNHFENANKLWSFLRKLTYKKINTAVSLTQEDLSNFKKVNSNSICIYNPVSISNFKFGYSKNKTALAVGRYTRQKGFDILIEAWNMVHNKYSDWNLKIIGEGEEKSNLELKINDYGLSDTIKLSSPTLNIVEEYNNSNVFILSSRYEGFCLVLIEALSIGVPVIAFDCKTGPKEVLAEGGGILVEPENPHKLADAIINFIENSEQWDEISSLAITNGKRFTLENYFNEWDSLVYGIVNK